MKLLTKSTYEQILRNGKTRLERRVGTVSRCGDELARTALYEAAHTLLVRSRKWSSLRAWGMNIAKRRGMRAHVPRSRPQAGYHPPSPVERCNRFPFRQVRRSGSGITQMSEDARRIEQANRARIRVKRIVPVGRWAR